MKRTANREINMPLSRHNAAKIVPLLYEHLSYRTHSKKKFSTCNSSSRGNALFTKLHTVLNIRTHDKLRFNGNCSTCDEEIIVVCIFFTSHNEPICRFKARTVKVKSFNCRKKLESSTWKMICYWNVFNIIITSLNVNNFKKYDNVAPNNTNREL